MATTHPLVSTTPPDTFWISRTSGVLGLHSVMTMEEAPTRPPFVPSISTVEAKDVAVYQLASRAVILTPKGSLVFCGEETGSHTKSSTDPRAKTSTLTWRVTL